MARSSKPKKINTPKKIKNVVIVPVSDTTAIADTSATLDGSIKPPSSVNKDESSSSNAQSSATNDMKRRVESIPTIELNNMAMKQLLAELESTIPQARRVRMSSSRIATDSH